MSDVYKFRLNRPFYYESNVVPRYSGSNSLNLPNPENPWLSIDRHGGIKIRKGYAWDGCSPKHKFFDLFLIGTPDGIINVNTGKPKTYYASMVHDALYQFMDHPAFPYSRKDADLIFYQLLCEADFKPARLYFLAVRLFGRARKRAPAALKAMLKRGKFNG